MLNTRNRELRRPRPRPLVLLKEKADVKPPLLKGDGIA
jgi:hypothetical protein